MLISRDDLRFWDVRTRERRMRRGEMKPADVAEYMKSIGDATDKATVSAPLDEPDERAHERRHVPIVRVTMPAPSAEGDLDDLPDDDDEDDEDLDDEDDDDDDFLK